jgi:hypothetical protein
VQGPPTWQLPDQPAFLLLLRARTSSSSSFIIHSPRQLRLQQLSINTTPTTTSYFISIIYNGPHKANRSVSLLSIIITITPRCRGCKIFLFEVVCRLFVMYPHPRNATSTLTRINNQQSPQHFITFFDHQLTFNQ